MRSFSSILGVAVLTFCLTSMTCFAAEDASIDLNGPDVIRHALEQQSGKRVKLKLLSGQDLDGKVQKIGAQAVTLAELGGMDFYDATVRLDQIAAVLAKVRGK